MRPFSAIPSGSAFKVEAGSSPLMKVLVKADAAEVRAVVTSPPGKLSPGVSEPASPHSPAVALAAPRFTLPSRLSRVGTQSSDLAALALMGCATEESASAGAGTAMAVDVALTKAASLLGDGALVQSSLFRRSSPITILGGRGASAHVARLATEGVSALFGSISDLEGAKAMHSVHPSVRETSPDDIFVFEATQRKYGKPRGAATTADSSRLDEEMKAQRKAKMLSAAALASSAAAGAAVVDDYPALVAAAIYKVPAMPGIKEAYLIVKPKINLESVGIAQSFGLMSVDSKNGHMEKYQELNELLTKINVFAPISIVLDIDKALRAELDSAATIIPMDENILITANRSEIIGFYALIQKKILDVFLPTLEAKVAEFKSLKLSEEELNRRVDRITKPLHSVLESLQVLEESAMQYMNLIEIHAKPMSAEVSRDLESRLKALLEKSSEEAVPKSMVPGGAC